jgi:hypothetical protein
MTCVACDPIGFVMVGIGLGILLTVGIARWFA